VNQVGKIIAVLKDNDNGVYQHGNNKDGKSPTASQIEKRQKIYKNTSANGTKIGETEYWDEFANHDVHGNIIGDKQGNYANTNAMIYVGSNIDDYIQILVDAAKVAINSFNSSLKAKVWLQENSKTGRIFDIKLGLGEDNGYLLNGNYVSGETAGNYLFGKNLLSLYQSSTLAQIAYNKEGLFYKAAEAFGAYHNSSNHANNPSIKPYYGEIPYAGRAIVSGYYNNNQNNPIFNDYPQSAIYGNTTNK
jgi:hypothetical protein